MGDGHKSAAEGERFPGTFRASGRLLWGIPEPEERDMDEITVVGGGLAGLVAASEAAEAGAPVRLLEAHRHLGGRARSAGGPYVANLGPHALYAGTALWDWLRARGLHGPSPMPRSTHLRVRWRGEVRRTPPAGWWRAARLARGPAPDDRDLRSWATEHGGEEVARMLAGVAGPLTFDPDPGRLSAAFVATRIRRILLAPLPRARYVAGGWGALVDRLAAHARSVGVRIETGSPVGSLDDLGPGAGAGPGPVVVAVAPAAARRLLRDDALRVESPRVALLDVAVESRRRDPYLVFDLDEAAFLTRTTAVVPSLAPRGHQLVQASVGLRPGEGLASGEARLEAVLDAAFTGWRDRVAWRRRGLVTESTGALDLPGTTWRDRPPVAYAEGVWLAGDWVATPGHLAEVSCTSAVEAARAAVAARTVRSPRAGAPTDRQPATPGG
jgi:phytoene dehydrogenase-like protein